jgi:HEAT repeat protein
MARKSLDELQQLATPEARQIVLRLAGFLPPAKQRELIRAGLHNASPEVAAEAIRAIARLRQPEFAPELIARLTQPQLRRAASAGLVEWGSEVLPLLQQELALDPAPELVTRIAAVLGRISEPRSRDMLLKLVQQPNLFVRAAALRALTSSASSTDIPTDEAETLPQVLRKEFWLAHQLLSGMQEADCQELSACIRYELEQLQRRVFKLLRLLYSPERVALAERGLLLRTPEQQASALGLLNGLLPPELYQSVQALVEQAPVAEQVLAFNALYRPVKAPESVYTLLVELGETAFSPWTLHVALCHWRPEPHNVRQLLPLFESGSRLVRQAALVALQTLRAEGEARYQQILLAHPALIQYAMNHDEPTQRVPELERVLLLRKAKLFADIPENVLCSIAPILEERIYPDGATIFTKGEPGTCLFVVHSGVVSIVDQGTTLAEFGSGDYFGELALFDAEPRSATAVAAGPTVLLSLEQEDFYELLEERSEVLRNVLRTLGQRLRQQNQLLHERELTPPRTPADMPNVVQATTS